MRAWRATTRGCGRCCTTARTRAEPEPRSAAVAARRLQACCSAGPARCGRLGAAGDQRAAGRGGGRDRRALRSGAHRLASPCTACGWRAGVDHYTAPTDSARQDCIALRCGARRPSTSSAFPSASLRRAALPRHPSAAWPRSASIRAVHDSGDGRRRRLAPRAREHRPSGSGVDLNARSSWSSAAATTSCASASQRLPARMPLQALGFVDNVADLMRSADVLVTKAGGLTLAEAFCCGVPVVVYDVLPGQEAGNLEYVLRHDAVEYAATPEALARGGCRARHADPAACAARGRARRAPGAASPPPERIARNVLPARLQRARRVGRGAWPRRETRARTGPCGPSRTSQRVEARSPRARSCVRRARRRAPAGTSSTAGLPRLLR